MMEVKEVNNNNQMWKNCKSMIKFMKIFQKTRSITSTIQKEDTINSPNQQMMAKGQLRRYFGNAAFISKLKPKSYEEAQNDDS